MHSSSIHFHPINITMAMANGGSITILMIVMMTIRLPTTSTIRLSITTIAILTITILTIAILTITIVTLIILVSY